jgi:uncharacterized protein (TIRG00374 family)
MKSALLLAAGIAIIIFIAGYFGFSEIVEAAQNANISYIILALVLQGATLALLALRFMVISGPQGRIGFLSAFRVVMFGMVMDFLTPVAKVGGEPMKVYMLKKRFGTSKSSAIVSIDTVIEIIASFITALLIFLVFIKFLPASLYAYFIIFFAVVVISLAFVFKILTDFSWLKRIVDWLIKKISKYRRVGDVDYAKIFHSTFSQLIKDKKTMGWAFAITFLTKILEFARMWLVFLALGTVLPLDIVLILWAVLLILSMVPWLPGGLGLVEFGGISAFILFGIPKGIAASGMLIDRFISFWLILITGAIMFYVSKRNKERI